MVYLSTIRQVALLFAEVQRECVPYLSLGGTDQKMALYSAG